MSNWNPDQFKKYDTSKGKGNPKQWREKFKQTMKIKQLQDASSSEFPSLALCETLKDLKREFRRLITMYHPDKIGETKENTQRAQRLMSYYDNLRGQFRKLTTA